MKGGRGLVCSGQGAPQGSLSNQSNSRYIPVLVCPACC